MSNPPTKRRKTTVHSENKMLTIDEQILKMSLSECELLRKKINRRIRLLKKPMRNVKEKKRRAKNMQSLELMFSDLKGGTPQQRATLLAILKNNINCDRLIFEETDYSGVDGRRIEYSCKQLKHSYASWDTRHAGGSGWKSNESSFKEAFECATMDVILGWTSINVDVLLHSVINAFIENDCCGEESLFVLMD